MYKCDQLPEIVSVKKTEYPNKISSNDNCH